MIHGFDALAAGFDDQADVIVVGSGPGGAVAALNFVQAGLQTILIEAGPEVRPEEMTRDAPLFLAKHYWDGGARMIGGSAQIPSMQGRCLGGSSVVNSAIMFALPDWVRREWIEHDGLDFLAGEALDRSYERIFERTRTAPTPLAVMGRRNLLVRDALRSIGLEGAPLPRAVAGCEGHADCITGCASGKKQSVDRSYLREASELGARIYTCSMAERILFDGGSATGISGTVIDPRTRERRGRFTVRAPRVVLAAGAAHTPALLLHNGVTAGGAVGGSFFAHLGAGLVGIVEEEVDPWIGATQGWGAFSKEIRGMKYESLWAPPSLLMVRWGDVGLPFLEGLSETKHAVVMALVYRARMQGRVRSSWNGMPRLSLKIPEDEVATVMRGLKSACDGLFNVGAHSVYTGIPVLPMKLTRKEETEKIVTTRVLPRDLPITANHIFGSCPMSRDPDRGAVDTEGRVKGVGGLWIADASLFPSPSAVNPQATIMALSDLVSRRIAERAS